VERSSHQVHEWKGSRAIDHGIPTTRSRYTDLRCAIDKAPSGTAAAGEYVAGMDMGCGSGSSYGWEHTFRVIGEQVARWIERCQLGQLGQMR
jgi:hypothetical protein